MLFNFLLVVQVVVSVGIVVLVMLQHGKGADAGPALSGGSQSLFGSSGGGNALSRITAIMAAIFLSNSMAMMAISSNQQQRALDSVISSEGIVAGAQGVDAPEDDASVPEPQ